MAASVCSFFQFGHCKLDNRCPQLHNDKKCDVPNCLAEDCTMRHPKDCRYLRTFGFCKFGLFCSYEHSLQAQVQTSSQFVPVEALNIARESFENEIKNAVEEKNREIAKLCDEISKLEDKISSFVAKENERIHDTSDENIDIPEEFECSICDFKTGKEVGLKIHRSQKHSEGCGETLNSENHLKSHICDIENIENLEAGEFFIDEKEDTANCFSIWKGHTVSPNKVVANLHSMECWESGSCWELPLPPSLDPVMNPQDVLNMLIGSIINSGVVDWEKFSLLANKVELDG